MTPVDEGREYPKWTAKGRERRGREYPVLGPPNVEADVLETRMATAKKGQLVRAPEWWKHLRWTKRAFWKSQRKAEKRDVLVQTQDD